MYCIAVKTAIDLSVHRNVLYVYLMVLEVFHYRAEYFCFYQLHSEVSFFFLFCFNGLYEFKLFIKEYGFCLLMG